MMMYIHIRQATAYIIANIELIIQFLVSQVAHTHSDDAIVMQHRSIVGWCI